MNTPRLCTSHSTQRQWFENEGENKKNTIFSSLATILFYHCGCYSILHESKIKCSILQAILMRTFLEAKRLSFFDCQGVLHRPLSPCIQGDQMMNKLQDKIKVKSLQKATNPGSSSHLSKYLRVRR